jgi:hypothetical protein
MISIFRISSAIVLVIPVLSFFPRVLSISSMVPFPENREAAVGARAQGKQFPPEQKKAPNGLTV